VQCSPRFSLFNTAYGHTFFFHIFPTKKTISAILALNSSGDCEPFQDALVNAPEIFLPEWKQSYPASFQGEVPHIQLVAFFSLTTCKKKVSQFSKHPTTSTDEYTGIANLSRNWGANWGKLNVLSFAIAGAATGHSDPTYLAADKAHNICQGVLYSILIMGCAQTFQGSGLVNHRIFYSR